jgi:hypothetical protein
MGSLERLEHPRFVVRYEHGGWEVYDELVRFAVFGADRRRACEDYARFRNGRSS